MRPIVLKCPSCDRKLTVSRLRCPDCEINLDGEFAMPALLKLTPPQIDFIEVFIKNRGVIRDVERELGVSYPTVRARLDEAIHALGYGAKSATGGASSDDGASRRRAILAELKAGKLTPEEALAALNDRSEKE
jgi:hypothetical protein